MYADKDRQREKTRERVRRYRALQNKPDSGGKGAGRYTPIVTPLVWGGPSAWEAWRSLSPSFVVDDKADSVDRPLPPVRKRIVMRNGIPCVVE